MPRKSKKDEVTVDLGRIKEQYELLQKDENLVIQEDEYLKRGYKILKSTERLLYDYQHKVRVEEDRKIELSEIVNAAVKQYIKDKL